MKNFIAIFLLALPAFFIACNNEGDNKTSTTVNKTLADTLMTEVEEGHNVGMGKMGKLTRAEQETQRILDSIAKLPAKAQQLAAPYKLKMDSLLSELKYAESAMDKWMSEFNRDSAINDMNKRIDYLTSEKNTVQSVKESILKSLQKADSLIKKKI